MSQALLDMSELTRDDIVQQWEVDNPTVDNKSVVNRLLDECVRHFKSVAKSDVACDRFAPQTLRSLDRSRSNLILWSDGHGLDEGHLDKVLSKSEFLRRNVLKLLINIASIIVTRKY